MKNNRESRQFAFLLLHPEMQQAGQGKDVNETAKGSCVTQYRSNSWEEHGKEDAYCHGDEVDENRVTRSVIAILKNRRQQLNSEHVRD